MSERPRSDLTSRLRLVDSLLTAASDTLSSVQRVLEEVHKEVQLARREEEDASRDDEIRALRREVEQLREGMASRSVIERAKGILMCSYSIPETRAFELLTEISQRRHRKLRDVAADVVSGTLDPPLVPAARGGPAPRPAGTPADGLAADRPTDDQTPAGRRSLVPETRIPTPSSPDGARS